MADPTFKLCDICGATVDASLRLCNIAVGESPDPSGNGYQTDCVRLDLCPKHLADAVFMLLRDPKRPGCKNHEMGLRLVEWAREQASKG